MSKDFGREDKALPWSPRRFVSESAAAGTGVLRQAGQGAEEVHRRFGGAHRGGVLRPEERGGDGGRDREGEDTQTLFIKLVAVGELAEGDYRAAGRPASPGGRWWR